MGMELEMQPDEVVNLFDAGWMYDHSGLSSEVAATIEYGVLHLPGREGVRRQVRFAWLSRNNFQNGRMEPVFEVLGRSAYYFASAFAAFEVAGKVIPALGRKVLPRIRP